MPAKCSFSARLITTTNATAFLSMWISNTATTAMMMPIMEAVLIELEGTTASASTELMLEVQKDKSKTNMRKLLAMSVLLEGYLRMCVPELTKCLILSCRHTRRSVVQKYCQHRVTDSIRRYPSMNFRALNQ